ncbi:MAG: nucleoside hydrolase [Candidatus Caldatribacterium sp.]|nr:nucleoside hydrolase [Candidatus Caldatribacterium sp.]
MKTKVIIDTDIGDDVDDALAIALALCSPELEIVGITTVFRNTTLRAKLAKKLVQVFGRPDIPVVKGIEKPLINDWDRTLIPPQTRAVKEEIPIDEEIGAVDFIVDRVMNSSDQITLITIGPLTNVAIALTKEPRLKERTRICMMGGMYSQAFPEWNIYCDPEAARIVFDSGIPITMVGLDVTLQCRLNKAALNRIFESGDERMRFLSEVIKIWQEGDENRYPILHDPLAVAVLIDPSFVKMKKMNIKVETRGELTRGVTVVTENPFQGFSGEGSVNVCVDVESERFVRFFLERILAPC